MNRKIIVIAKDLSVNKNIHAIALEINDDTVMVKSGKEEKMATVAARDAGFSYLTHLSTREEFDRLEKIMSKNKGYMIKNNTPTMHTVTVAEDNFKFNCSRDIYLDHIPGAHIIQDIDGNMISSNVTKEKVEKFLRTIGEIDPENSLIYQIESHSVFSINDVLTKSGMNSDWHCGITNPDKLTYSIWIPESECGNYEWFFNYDEFLNAKKIDDKTWELSCEIIKIIS
jgi:hypothetical protein